MTRTHTLVNKNLYIFHTRLEKKKAFGGKSSSGVVAVRLLETVMFYDVLK